jgi:hypothetical protein
MSRFHRQVLVPVLALTAMGTMVSCATAQPAVSKREGEQKSQAATEPQSIRFVATVYEVQIAEDRFPQLDAQKLAAAADTPESLHKALGAARILYHLDQSVYMGLPGEKKKCDVTIAHEMPLRRLALVGNPPITTVSHDYKEIGIRFELQVYPSDGDNHDRRGIDLTIRLMEPYLREAEIEKGMPVAIDGLRVVTFQHGGVLNPDRPILLIGGDGSRLGKDQAALAYVVRVVMTPVETK